MSLESETDRLELLKALGEIVDVSGSNFYAIFGKDYIGLEFDAGIESSIPQITLRTSDAKKIFRGDTVTRQGSSYLVESKEDDGEGMTAIRLQEL